MEPDATTPIAVLVPPLLMPRQGMLPLKWRLERGGVETRLFGYPSYREDIPANAARLAAYMHRVGERPIDIVAFSLGGIVARWAVNHAGAPAPRRVVMIGTPNRGARIAASADRLLGPLFPLMWGRCARQLRPGDEGLCDRAGIFPPGTDLGVIAGGTGTPRGVNPLLRGDNDRIVTVEETKLDGMHDFAQVRAAHGPLIFHPRTAELTLAFLRDGRFSVDEKLAIPA